MIPYTPLYHLQNKRQNYSGTQNCMRLLDAQLEHWQPKKINMRSFMQFKALLKDFFETIEYLNPKVHDDACEIALIDAHLAIISARLGFQEYCPPYYQDLTEKHIGNPGNRPEM